MSNYLEIDTDELRSAATTADQTNSQITEALNMLNKIVVHNDWVCVERDAINNNTIEYQSRIAQIQAKSTNFYNAIKSSSDMFDQEEQNQITSTNGVDELIAGILNVVPRSISGESEAAASGISIVNFDNVSSTMSGGGGGHSFGSDGHVGSSGISHTGGGNNG